MCGIAGFIGTQPLAESQVQGALEAMYRRGPDYQDHRAYQQGDQYVHLLHARLSIIDLDARSHQPFEKHGLSLVFNGEIYNYLEIRHQLLADGVRFSTSSDTEVLLEAYRKWGEQCVTHFEGMWAFALYDLAEGKLLLSRDRFGEKPLYYRQTGEGLYFASETNTLHVLCGMAPQINTDHLLRYVVNGHKSLYKTSAGFFNDISELGFAQNTFANGKDPIRPFDYWRPTVSPQKMTEEEAIEGARYHLIESLRIRLRSDVPLAFCLSGGVDSASLVSIAAKEFNSTVQTFSIIDQDPRYDEREHIQATIDDTGCACTQIMLDPNENYKDRLVDLVNYHDAPVATISYLVHSVLSQEIAANGYRISMSGTAADELFTGYYDHFNLHLYEMRDHPRFEEFKADWEREVRGFVRHPGFRKFDLYFDNPTIRDHIYLNNEVFGSFLKGEFHESFSETHYTGKLLRNRMLNELFHEVVRVILHEDDLNSMRYSIENRSPFLDKRLFDFAYSIPEEYLIKEGYNKYILRSAMKGILNDKVRLNREKKGFNASLNSIFDFDNPDHVAFFLDDSPIFELFNKASIEKVIKQKEFPNSYKKFLFNFINAKIFLERHA